MVKRRGINVYEKAWEQLTREKSFEGYVPDQVCIALNQNGEWTVIRRCFPENMSAAVR